MTHTPESHIGMPRYGGPLSGHEFVAMIAFCLAMNALAIDTMLPALDEIAEHYFVASGNQQQWVIFAYILGFGVPQLFAGPISDRFGRKIVLRISFFFYVIFGFACMFMPSFETLLAARLCHGISAAGIRVTATSIVRDLYAGRNMARTMSLIMTVFMVVPILAPGIGQVILTVTDWRWTFGVLGVLGALLWCWIELRLPETLASNNRRPLRLAVIAAGYKQILTTPVTIGYMLASGILFGSLFAFIGASEQIFSEVFDQEKYFALWFAGIAIMLSIANFTNARVVQRYGMRRISHSALILFTSLSLINYLLTLHYGPHLIIFFPLFAICFGCFGMVGANFSALAMEPLGKLAGTGAAAYGFATTTVASLFGWSISSQYDGTVTPILLGYTVLGAAALLTVLITEKGRLFKDGSAQRQKAHLE